MNKKDIEIDSALTKEELEELFGGELDAYSLDNTSDLIKLSFNPAFIAWINSLVDDIEAEMETIEAKLRDDIELSEHEASILRLGAAFLTLKTIYYSTTPNSGDVKH